MKERFDPDVYVKMLSDRQLTKQYFMARFGARKKRK